jgi:hypothetical protein
VNRKAAWLCGQSAAERNAIIIDRFFDTKQKALAWAKANPHFMVVQVRTLEAEAGLSDKTTPRHIRPGPLVPPLTF